MDLGYASLTVTSVLKSLVMPLSGTFSNDDDSLGDTWSLCFFVTCLALYISSSYPATEKH